MMLLVVVYLAGAVALYRSAELTVDPPGARLPVAVLWPVVLAVVTSAVLLAVAVVLCLLPFILLGALIKFGRARPS